MKGKIFLLAVISTISLLFSPGAFAYCYYGWGTTCDDPEPAPAGNGDPTPMTDQNSNNKLDKIVTFSGKNYNVAVAGSDLVKDNNGDGQANALSLGRSVNFNLPTDATVAAAFLIYSGTIYYKDSSYNVKDDSSDTTGGGEAALDSNSHAASNKIDFSINGTPFRDVTPANMGGNSRAATSWWYMHPSAGTLKDTKVGFYSNRLDITDHVANLSGNVTVRVDDLQRADFSGNAKGSSEYWTYYPNGINGNGERANDCLSSVSYSVVVIYSRPTGAKKTVTLMEGMAWAWQTDFATDYSKAYNAGMVNGPLVLDVNVTHAAIKGTGTTNLYIGAIDGDKYGDNGAPQCGASSIPHSTGHDHTWVKSGSGARKYYQDIYEGKKAPSPGNKIGGYNNVTSIAKGLNYNITKIGVQSLKDGATNTLLHVEGDAEDSTDAGQEALLLNFVVLEGDQK